MNNSWGGQFDSANTATVAKDFAAAYEPFVIDKGGLVVFAAGDDGADNPSDLASLPHWAPDLERGWLVAVSADTPTSTMLAKNSNQCGRAMDYCLTVPTDGLVVSQYQDFQGKDGWSLGPISGTSNAAPQISGTAALVWQAYPYFDNDLVRQTLLGTATDMGDKGVDKVFGWGMLNADKAVKGPGIFAWGDVSVNFDDITSTWSNDISGKGGLVKNGTGTLVLAGDDTYSGGTTVSGGTLQIGNGGKTGSITGNVTNNGSLVFDRSDDLTYKGVISGSGSLVQAGTGSLTLTATHTYTGGTTVEKGATLRVGDGGTTGWLGVGGVTDNGRLVFDRSDDITYGDVVSGTGELEKAGSGTLILTGVNTYTGVTLISGGTLQVGNGGATGSLAQRTFRMANGTKLVFNSSSDQALGSFLGSGADQGVHATLVQEGSGKLILQGDVTDVLGITVKPNATLQVGNGGSGGSSLEIDSDIANSGFVVTEASHSVILAGAISGNGSLTKNGSGILYMTGANTYTGGTFVNAGTLRANTMLPGDATIAVNGRVSGASGVSGNLSNAGMVSVHGGDTTVGGNYTQASTGTLAVSLGSKLDVTGAATLNGGTLEITGTDDGYVANTHTDVLTAAGGVNGTFNQLTKDTGVVFTSTTINYDGNSVWLDTTGLNITTAAAGGGVTYTAASMDSAQRVEGAFEQLDSKIASGSIDSVSNDFVQNAGQFQQSPNYRAAQASLESLSGQLHAASAGMTLQAIDATGRALSDRWERLSLQPVTDKPQMWMSQLQQGGSMTRSGFAGVDYQLNGWLVGRDVRLDAHTFAGFAFSQGQGIEQLSGRFDRNRSRNSAGMAYLGWLGQSWYAHGRVGMGHYHQNMNRRLLLGASYQGVWTDYDGHYNVAYGEAGRHFQLGTMRLTPFVDLEYDRVTRNSFAEHGAGGFGLKADDHTVSRWQSGLGLKLARRWDFTHGRWLSLDARAQWRQTLSANGMVFDASFVGLDEWRPLTGVGLSRRSAVFGLDLNAKPSDNTHVKLGYAYLTGDRGRAGVASASFSLAF